MEILLIRDCS